MKIVERAISSVVLAGVMVISMGMSAWSSTAKPEEVESAQFTKTITTDDNTYAPNISFKFVVDQGKVQDSVIEGVIAGVENGLTVDSIKFEPSKDDDRTKPYTKSGYLWVDINKFDAAGVYYYTLKEDVPIKPYSGITYDEKVYHVYVTIWNNENDGSLYCAGIRTIKLTDDDNWVKDDSFVFTNDYGDANDSTHDVTIKKNVTGNQGDKTQEFQFNIKIKADEDGEIFKYVKTSTNGTRTSGSITGDKSVVGIPLKHGESVTVYGLTAGDVVDVHEDTKYSEPEYGYTVTRKITGEGVELVDENDDSNGFIATITKDGSAVVIENNKNVGAATGLALTFGPYVLMVGLAGVFAVMFLRKKNGIDEI